MRTWSDGIKNPEVGDRVRIPSTLIADRHGWGTVLHVKEGRYFIKYDHGARRWVDQFHIENGLPGSAGRHEHSWTYVDPRGNTRCITCGAFKHANP